VREWCVTNGFADLPRSRKKTPLTVTVAPTTRCSPWNVAPFNRAAPANRADARRVAEMGH